MAGGWANPMQSQVHLIPLCQLGNGVTVYGFRYPGLLNCLSWCYLTIAKNVVIATQPENDCGTSLTNTWSKAFFELLRDLPPVKAAGQGANWRWFEHYYERSDPALDEVFLDPQGRAIWKFGARLAEVQNLFEELTGEPIPDFEALGFARQIQESIRRAPDPLVFLKRKLKRC
jgi:hypothetical protein